MKCLKRVVRVTAALLMVSLVTLPTVHAQIGPDPHSNARQSRIVGAWDVEVTITRCDNGAPLFRFPALHKYERGGTGQVVPATDPAALSAHVMVWNHAGGNNYQTAIKMFQFDGDGNYVGWVVVTSEVSIDDGGNEYTGSGVAQFFNTAGNLVGGSCPLFSGIRFTGES